MIVHPVRLYTELYDFSPFELGSIRIQGNKILAIVIDVSQDTPCRYEWVSSALRHIFEYVNRVNAPALHLPLLGHHYGGLQVDTCLQLICEALLEHQAHLPPDISLHLDSAHHALAHLMLAAAGLMENRVYPLFRD